MQHNNDNHTPLADAQFLLASIGYRESWTIDELRAACADMSPTARGRIVEALRITAAAAFAEAERLELER